MNRRLLVGGSFRRMARYKLRTFLMSLGIVIGVASLVAMRSLGAGAEREMMERMNRMFSGATVLIGNSGGGLHAGVRQPGKLDLEDLEVIGERLEAVVDWDPLVMTGEEEVRYQDLSRALSVLGHSERAPLVWGRGARRGRYFGEAEVRSAARVALIGSKTARELFGTDDPIGRTILIGGAPYRVLGVLENQGFDPHGFDRDDEVHIPITTMMSRLRNLTIIGSAKLLLSGPEVMDDAVEEIAALLEERHGLGPDDPDDFTIYTPTGVQRAVHSANRVLALYLPATAGIALLVAAVVIANLMLMGVRERVAEIGLRKAVGATDRQIAGQFLLESLAVTLIAGALGVGLGVAGLALAAAHHAGRAVVVAPDSVALGLAAALVVGTLAGVLPARRAARQEPADALR